MSDTTSLQPALAGDQLSPADLQSAADLLAAQADELDAQIATVADAATAADIVGTQTRLRTAALKLVARSIKLRAGEAKIGAEHIAATVAAVQKTIDSIGDVKRKLEKLGKVLDFVATLLTGSGTKIVEGALKLKDELGK